VAVAVAGQITAIRNEEAGVDFGHLVGAGLNVAPPAVFVLGSAASSTACGPGRRSA
jgi:hypothetical protein